DAHGVAPGVELSLTNDETRISRPSLTNGAGEYAFTDVVPGLYTLRAVLAGYKTFERRGLVIGTQEFLTIDVALEVGAIQEEVVVTGAAPIVERANASTGQVLDKKSLDALPNHARNSFTIASLLPTVVSFGDPA